MFRHSPGLLPIYHCQFLKEAKVKITAFLFIFIFLFIFCLHSLSKITWCIQQAWFARQDIWNSKLAHLVYANPKSLKSPTVLRTIIHGELN